mmetsp:Transcript_64654/g.151966  ORF Transcript_64654/g.151966 Transcript_64654/m.151966 type:complete len:170 (-) Transcript_64654:1261-1770(-)
MLREAPTPISHPSTAVSSVAIVIFAGAAVLVIAVAWSANVIEKVAVRLPANDTCTLSMETSRSSPSPIFMASIYVALPVISVGSATIISTASVTVTGVPAASVVVVSSLVVSFWVVVADVDKDVEVMVMVVMVVDDVVMLDIVEDVMVPVVALVVEVPVDEVAVEVVPA